LVTPVKEAVVVKIGHGVGAKSIRHRNHAVGQDDGAGGDDVVHRADNQFRAEFLRATVAKFNEFGKFMAGFDVQKRHRNVRRTKRFFREAQQADGILAAGKKQGRALEFARDFTHDVNRLRFEILQMV